ncbi:MAG: hypothetical protein ACI4LA_07550 [Emergencia sp.]
MSCFGIRVTPDLYQNCCNSSNLCEFNGCLEDVSTAPVYVQQVFDAVRFNLQGMKTIGDQRFHPCIPKGHRVKRVIDIRCRRCFNPDNVDDPHNLTLDVHTDISGATFLKDCKGNELRVIGTDGTYSERIMYAETSECDSQCKGTPVFGTQSVSVSGNVHVELDLLLCDSCNAETVFTVCADVNIAEPEHPMILTNFFEICMPSAIDTAFLPRFTEFCNSACEARLATNNCGRDLTSDRDGQISGNLIVAICLTCEKKIVVPVQLCVLSTGYVQAPLQQNAVCSTFPGLFPSGIREADTECCRREDDDDPSEDECREKEKESRREQNRPPVRPHPGR